MKTPECRLRLAAGAGAAACLAAAASAQQDLYGSDVRLDVTVRIDPVALTGSIVGPQGPIGDALTGLAGDPATRRMWAINAGDGRLWTVDPDIGAATVLTGPLFLDNANGLAFDPAGERLYVSDVNANRLMYYDLAAGRRVDVGVITGASEVEGLAYDPNTRELFGLDDAAHNIVRIDTSTAVATALSPPGSLPGSIWRGLDMDPSTRTLYASRVNSPLLAAVNADSGAVTVLGWPAGIGSFCQGLAWMGETGGECYPDCDTSTGPGILDIFDFLCFQSRYGVGAPYACDCDVTTGPGVCDVFDFLCYQNAFDRGCP